MVGNGVGCAVGSEEGARLDWVVGENEGIGIGKIDGAGVGT